MDKIKAQIEKHSRYVTDSGDRDDSEIITSKRIDRESTQSNKLNDVEFVIDEVNLTTTSSKIYLVIYGIIAILFLGLAWGLYHYYPFISKLTGKWNSSDSSGYELTVIDSKGYFTIENVQSSNVVNMVFEGNIKGVGANRYRLENITVYLDIDKTSIAKQEIETLTQQTELYKVIKNNDDTLRLQYTNIAISTAFSFNLERMFYFTLENFKYQMFAQDLRVRSQALSQTSFIMEREH